MARPERPIRYPGSALGKLAAHLRHLRAHKGLTYGQLEALTHMSASTLSRAASGHRLPRLEVALAYEKACEGDGAVRYLWERASQEARGRSRVVSIRAPRIDLVSTRGDLSRALVQVHLDYGSPSMRELERRVDARVGDYGPLSRSTANRFIRRRGFPTSVMQMCAFLRACGVPEHELLEWRRAWRRATFDHLLQKSAPGAEPRPPTRGQHAAEILRAGGYEPMESYRGFASPWTCRCQACRAVVRVRLSDIWDGKTRCSVCFRSVSVSEVEDRIGHGDLYGP